MGMLDVIGGNDGNLETGRTYVSKIDRDDHGRELMRQQAGNTTRVERPGSAVAVEVTDYMLQKREETRIALRTPKKDANASAEKRNSIMMLPPEAQAMLAPPTADTSPRRRSRTSCGGD